MNKKSILLLFLLIVLSVFTYFQHNELEKSKEYTKELVSEMDNIENELIDIQLRLNEKEKELDVVKYHYKMEYEIRNIIDSKVREIYYALRNKDIEYLKTEVSSDVKIENEKIIFEDGYIYNLLDRKNNFVLRQRHYTLNENNTTFFTGYELINTNWEFLPVCNFQFVYENGEWKLNNIYEE